MNQHSGGREPEGESGACRIERTTTVPEELAEVVAARPVMQLMLLMLAASKYGRSVAQEENETVCATSFRFS